MRRFGEAIRGLVLAAAMGLVSGSGALAAEDAIGRIKAVESEVVITRDGAENKAAVGTRVFRHNIVRTAEKSKTGITFRDQTRLAIGPKSIVELKDYAFEPTKEGYSFVTKVTRGTLHYVSGLIAKLSPSAASVEMPGGTIGVRDTTFVVRVTGE